jgi:hypothetical protein
MHYFEVRKLPPDISVENELELMLSLFRARTEKDLRKLEGLGVSVVRQAIEAYREITASPEFRELERLREDARHNEAAALRHARQEAEKARDAKWRGVVADKDAALAAALADKDAALADKDAVLADKDAEIAALRALLGERK